jgi:hypothetical protein
MADGRRRMAERHSDIRRLFSCARDTIWLSAQQPRVPPAPGPPRSSCARGP